MIIIELDNKVVFGDGHEYPIATKLTGSAAKYINIPKSIILDNEMDSKRVAVFTYILSCIGRWDNICRFNLPNMVKWCGNKPKNGKDGINAKFINTIDELSDRGYLTYLNENIDVKHIECDFDFDYYRDDYMNNGFGVIYFDEVEKIMNYKNEKKDNLITNSIILLVFTYFRFRIIRRSNKLKTELGERNVDGTNNHTVDVQTRRLKKPDAYEDTFDNIANLLGISDKTLLKAVDILEQLDLIVTDRAYRVKDEEGKYHTPKTIFANTYKREREFLLASGDEYCRTEIENRAKIINEYGGNYKIDKTKRRI